MVLAHQDAWRKHPFITGCAKKPFPGLGIASVIFGAYLVVDVVAGDSSSHAHSSSSHGSSSHGSSSHGSSSHGSSSHGGVSYGNSGSKVSYTRAEIGERPTVQ